MDGGRDGVYGAGRPPRAHGPRRVSGGPKPAGPLERLAAAPSPAPTPSPSPLEDRGLQPRTSPGRLSPDLAEEPRSLEPSPSPGLPEEHGEVAMALPGRPCPGAVGPEELALRSSRRAGRPGRRGLGPARALLEGRAASPDLGWEPCHLEHHPCLESFNRPLAFSRGPLRSSGR